MALFFSPPVKKNISERSLFPIVSADILLSPDQRKDIVQDIRKTVNISDEYFNIIYRPLINDFVKFVQLLPSNNEARLGSMMDDGLLRALYALQLQKNESNDNQPDPLVVYTLFSTSLLFDIGFITNNRTVIISEKDGSFIKEWLPSEGRMRKSDGEYYRIRYGGGMTQELSRKANVIFAQQLMPLVGFDWIARDPSSFNSWITILNNEKEDVNNLIPYINKANKRLIDEPQKEFLFKANIKAIEPEETALGEDFIEWLKNGLEAKTIIINTPDSYVHVIENGLFLETPGIINKFCAQSPKNPAVNIVFSQLKKIGFIKLNGVDEQPITYVYEDEQQQDSKSLVRKGVEILMPCFMFAILTNHFHFIEEKLKKKLKILKQIKLRHRRIDDLIKSIKESTLLILNLNKERFEFIDISGKAFKKWLDELNASHKK